MMLCLFTGIVAEAQTTTKIYLLRHADRTNGDDLTPLGLARANDLKRYLTPTRVHALFSTNFVRTRKTLLPLETQQRPITLYANTSALITQIRSNWTGRRVIVVGHSDTVPAIVQACGCASPFPALGIPSNQYDNLLLLIVHWSPAGVPTCELLAMKYGGNTP